MCHRCAEKKILLQDRLISFLYFWNVRATQYTSSEHMSSRSLMKKCKLASMPQLQLLTWPNLSPLLSNAIIIIITFPFLIPSCHFIFRNGCQKYIPSFFSYQRPSQPILFSFLSDCIPHTYSPVARLSHFTYTSKSNISSHQNSHGF